jgi:hypothetical protein
MAKPIELGLLLEGEDAERFFEYDENPEVSNELIAMFIEGKEIMSKTGENFRAPSSELVIVPLNEHHNLLSFNCLKNTSQALKFQLLLL